MEKKKRKKTKPQNENQYAECNSCQVIWHKACPLGLSSCFLTLLLHSCHHSLSAISLRKMWASYLLFLGFCLGFFLTSPDVVLLFQAWYHFLFQHYKPQFYQCQGQIFPDLTLLASQCTEKIIYDACF